MRNFNKFYHDDEWIEKHIPEQVEFDYKNADRLLPFNSSHPKVMQNRVKTVNWDLNIDLRKVYRKMPFRRILLQKLEDITGWRIGEYRNYRIIK